MGRATSGVKGMEFRAGDSMLSMSVIRAHAEDETTEQQYVFTITDGGFAKRTPIEEYRLQSRGGPRHQDDEAGRRPGQPGRRLHRRRRRRGARIKQSGQVTRSAIDDHLRPTSRDTKGVKFVGVSDSDAVAVVARSVESRLEHNLEALTPEAAAAVEAAGGATIEPVDASRPRRRAPTPRPDDARPTPARETDAETEEP